ncbi:hypothetical protein V6N13_130141 [Hibiscus sabdariffa]
MGSPLEEEDLRDAKKGRHVGDSSTDLVDCDMGNVDTDAGISPDLVLPWDSEQPTLDSRASYASVVRDGGLANKVSEDVTDLAPDKVIVRDEDCVVDRSGSRFSALESDVTEPIPVDSIVTEAPSSTTVTAAAGLGQPSSSPVRPLQSHDSGNGRNVDFWHDSWITRIGPLAIHVGTLNRAALPRVSVASMLSMQGTWNWPLFQHLLPFPVLLRIVDVKEPDSLFSEDTIRWGLTSNHNFTVKSAYELQFGSLSGDSDRV